MNTPSWEQYSFNLSFLLSMCCHISPSFVSLFSVSRSPNESRPASCVLTRVPNFFSANVFLVLQRCQCYCCWCSRWAQIKLSFVARMLFLSSVTSHSLSAQDRYRAVKPDHLQHSSLFRWLLIQIKTKEQRERDRNARGD